MARQSTMVVKGGRKSHCTQSIHNTQFASFQELDCLLSEHVMALHSRMGKEANAFLLGDRVRKQDLLDSSTIIDSEQPLRYLGLLFELV